MPTRLQISEHQPGDAAEIFLRACSDHPVREQLRECQSAGQICEPHEQKKAERDQYITLAGRHRTARLLGVATALRARTLEQDRGSPSSCSAMPTRLQISEHQ